MTVPERARAQATATAEALFRAGRDASARGDHSAACTHYRESYRVERALGTLLNIAVCEEALGELASALQTFGDVLASLPPEDIRIAFVRARKEALEARIPRIIVRLADQTPEDARVEIDESELPAASLGLSLPWNPGEHELRVTAQGHETSRYPFTLAEGQLLTLEIDAGEALEPPARAIEQPSVPAPRAVATHAVARGTWMAPSDRRTSEAPRASSTRRAIGYAGVGLGASGLLASAISFGLALDRKRVVDDHCPARLCDAEGSAAAQSGKDFLTVSWIGLAVGLVASAAGIYGLWPAEIEPAP
jgi:hypothetical protein